MDTSHVINSLGLGLDIAGVVLIFFFGLPSRIIKQGVLLLEGDITEKDKMKNKVIKRWAKTGMACLLLGFILQVISNFLI